MPVINANKVTVLYALLVECDNGYYDGFLANNHSLKYLPGLSYLKSELWDSAQSDNHYLPLCIHIQLYFYSTPIEEEMLKKRLLIIANITPCLITNIVGNRCFFSDRIFSGRIWCIRSRFIQTLLDQFKIREKPSFIRFLFFYSIGYIDPYKDDVFSLQKITLVNSFLLYKDIHMNPLQQFNYNPWPELPYKDFASTAYLLHMVTQVIGKLKLTTPFEPQWANVPLWINSRGLTSGLIPYHTGVFSIDIDLIAHKIIFTSSWQSMSGFKLDTMSVAEFTQSLFNLLSEAGIKMDINLMPQEVPNPIPFNKDTEQRTYNDLLANAWWRILVSSYRVMQQYHAKFNGKTPPIGFMWGTFDLRDARYQGVSVPTTGVNAEYIRRNAMNETQIETGWWSGNANYPRPAYYSFTYPQPKGIENSSIKPAAARWDNSLGLFVLDYDDVRQSKNPENTLYIFLESTYKAGSELAQWEKELVGTGKPV